MKGWPIFLHDSKFGPPKVSGSGRRGGPKGVAILLTSAFPNRMGAYKIRIDNIVNGKSSESFLMSNHVST